MPPSDEGGGLPTGSSEGEKTFRFPLRYNLIAILRFFSPPVSFADSPLIRGGLFWVASLHGSLYDHVDIFAYTTEIAVNIQVANSNHLQLHTVQV